MSEALGSLLALLLILICLLGPPAVCLASLRQAWRAWKRYWELDWDLPREDVGLFLWMLVWLLLAALALKLWVGFWYAALRVSGLV